ncbi:MAG: family 78 glycoside hydrolase catalytic domain, partial [Clostridia bacterium]|nr:family 78 glycoside hydrolase catalytic domain [Clostridia bacterium]
MKIYDIRINGAEPGLLMPASGLRFSWKISDVSDGFFQKFYRITLSDRSGTVFDTGRVESGISVDVEPEGLAAAFETEYKLRIVAWGEDGSEASEEAVFITEPSPECMHGAKWIKPEEHISGWAPYLRTKFDIGRKKPARAILYRTGLGIGEFFLNGERADDFEIDPPISNYEKTVYYRATDVTGLIKEGGNCLAVLLGEGFYSQSRVWGSEGMVYGDVCAFVRLKIVYEDGSEENIVSDTENWKYKYSPISINNIYGGEMYDSRLETPDFGLFEGSEKGWGPVVEDTTPKGKLTPCLMPPVRAIREIPCISMHCESGKSDGAWIFDMGVNFAGTYEVKIPAHSPRGAVYVFRTAEALAKGGNLDHRSTGGFATQCIQQDIYVARGGSEPEYYRPRFT